VKRAKTLFLIFSFVALMAGFLDAAEVTVIFSGQTHGMLYPCNCPIQQDGGISRRATLVKQLRKKYPALLLLDCGNFTAGGQLDEHTQNIQLDMQRSEVNYQALELMQYDAVGVGPDEFNFGRDFFLKHAKKNNPAYLSANLETDKVIPYLVKDCQGVKVALIGVTGSSASQKAEGLKINRSAMVGELVARLKKEGAQAVILLSTQGETEDLKLISEVKGIDVIFVGHNPQKKEELEKADETFLLRPFWQGRKLGKLTFKIADGKLADCRVEELLLSDKLSDDPAITAILPRCFSDVNCKAGELTGICQNPGLLNAACSFTEPSKINLFVINVKNCVTCDSEAVVNLLRKRFSGLTVKILNYPGQAAQQMIDDLGLQVLPAYIFPKSIQEEDNFYNLKDDLQLVKDFYVFKPQASGVSYFLKQEAKPGNFDLFFSIFEKDAGLLLTTLKEFKPSLHFLATQKPEGFEAKYGTPEVEEYLRAVCVEEYYPQKFLDYLICRSKNISSSYWEDCLSQPEYLKIKNCARTPEAADLLRENISLNEKLKIASGPSYLLENQEIFSSRGVPVEELRKILKQKKIRPE